MNNKILFVSNEHNDAHLLDAYSSTITGVVSNVSSAVAHIQVEKRVTDRRGKMQTMPASGSGFVISSDGYIITNNHVVEDAQKIQVHFSDGRQQFAELKGADPFN